MRKHLRPKPAQKKSPSRTLPAWWPKADDRRSHDSRSRALSRVADHAVTVVALAHQGNLLAAEAWVDELRAALRASSSQLLSRVPSASGRVVYLDAYRNIRSQRRAR